MPFTKLLSLARPVLCLLLLWAPPLFAKNLSPNCFELKDGTCMALSQLPADQKLREEFLALSPNLQRRFYERRQFLMKRLVGTLSYPRLFGAIAWTKEKGHSVIHLFRRSQASAPLKDEGEIPAEELDSAHSRDSLQKRGERALSSIVRALEDRLWMDAGYIAKSSGVGLTLVASPMVNTAIGRKGLFWSRGFSADVGVDFDHQSGYIRLYYDKQHLERAAATFIIGVSMDFFVHFRDLPLNEQVMQADHYKLPVVGGYRHGDTYRAYGAQIGAHVFEIAGALLTAYGHPVLGSFLIGSIQLFGGAMMYSASVQRTLLKKYTVPRSWIDRFLGPPQQPVVSLAGLCQEELMN